MKKQNNISRVFLRSLCLICSFFLLFSLFPAIAAEKAQKGEIRVLLTKPGVTDRIDIALDGSYGLNGVIFQRGCHLIISCATGRIFAYYEGMTMDCGTALTLIRYPVTEGENGLRLNGNYMLYEGSLSLTIREGKLRPILTINIEDYLQGVVPYEIGEDSPMEALKAQAIAARTYVISRIDSSRDYDVYDNTNDQVYLGSKAENKRSLEAIKETEGIVAFYGNTLAQCYYTASNGGQTESSSHCWGTNDLTYLTIKNDPYDLENPYSTVMTAKLSKDLLSAPLPSGLESSLLSALQPILSQMGYSDAKEDILLKAITGLSLADPLYPGTDSLLYGSVIFSLQISGKKLTAADDEEELYLSAPPSESTDPVEKSTTAVFQQLPSSISVKLPLYGEVEKLLSLSINATSNEIFTITEGVDSYTIESRRYGHGVGMSQRGAQTMASVYGKTYKDILSFYYPGVTLQKLTYTLSAVTPLAADFMITPGPAATPTPRPTPAPLTLTPKAEQYIVVVDNIATNSSLNLRSAPGMGGTILRVLYYGQQMIVTEVLGEWLHVIGDDFDGYVMSSFVTKK